MKASKSIIGFLSLRSYNRKVGSSTTPIIIDVKLSRENPSVVKLISPKERSISATARSVIPSKSSLAGFFVVSLTYFKPAATAITPIGMFMKKMYSQLTKVVMIPPKTMPSIAPLV